MNAPEQTGIAFAIDEDDRQRAGALRQDQPFCLYPGRRCCAAPLSCQTQMLPAGSIASGARRRSKARFPVLVSENNRVLLEGFLDVRTILVRRNKDGAAGPGPFHFRL